MKKLKRRNDIFGFSLTELVISMVIMGVAVLLLKVGINFMTGLSSQHALIESREQAQAVLYNILSEIRSATVVDSIEPDRIIFHHYDIELNNAADPNDAYDPNINLNLFRPGFEGQITYEYVADPSGGYLQRSFYIGGATETVKKLLRGMLLEPTALNYMFGNFPADDTNPPFVGAEVVFRLTPAFHRDVDAAQLQEKAYRGSAMIRQVVEQ